MARAPIPGSPPGSMAGSIAGSMAGSIAGSIAGSTAGYPQLSHAVTRLRTRRIPGRPRLSPALPGLDERNPAQNETLGRGRERRGHKPTLLPATSPCPESPYTSYDSMRRSHASLARGHPTARLDRRRRVHVSSFSAVAWRPCNERGGGQSGRRRDEGAPTPSGTRAEQPRFSALCLRSTRAPPPRPSFGAGAAIALLSVVSPGRKR